MCSSEAITAIPRETRKPDAVARHWIRMYNAVPKICIPFTNMDISFTVASTFVMIAVRLLAEFVLVNFLSWPEHSIDTTNAASCLSSIFHSTNLLPGLFSALRSYPYNPTDRLETAPIWWQNLVSSLLQFCTGYMLYDTLVGILMPHWPNLGSDDWMYLGHHFATSFYMTSTRVLGAGHMSAMMCMFLGELTNPFHNGFYFAEIAKKMGASCYGPLMEGFYQIDGFLFASSYCLIRVIVGPLTFVHMTYNIMCSPTRINIPLALRIFWVLMIWGVELGSYDWIVECWKMFQSYFPAGSETPEL